MSEEEEHSEGEDGQEEFIEPTDTQPENIAYGEEEETEVSQVATKASTVSRSSMKRKSNIQSIHWPDEDEGDEDGTTEADQDMVLDDDIDMSDDEEETEAEEGMAKGKKKQLSSDAESSPASDPEEAAGFERPLTPDFPPEYWQVQRLVKYIKVES